MKNKIVKILLGVATVLVMIAVFLWFGVTVDVLLHWLTTKCFA